MPALTVPAPDSDLAPSFNADVVVENLLGVALFDVNGLPREYFVTESNRSTGWVQIVFQALGLRSLLASSLKLEGFQQIAVNLTGSTAIVVRRRHDYVALLLKSPAARAVQDQSDSLNQWVSTLEQNFFHKHPAFIAA
jgi:hypothetical protein